MISKKNSLLLYGKQGLVLGSMFRSLHCTPLAARSRSSLGGLVKDRFQSAEPSSTLAINETVAARRSAGQPVFNFGLGQSPFPVPSEVKDSLASHAFQKDYLQVQGLQELRQSIASFTNRMQSKSNGTEFSFGADDVLVGPGTKELLFMTQMATTGYTVLPAPSWVTYGPQAFMNDRKLKWVQTEMEDGWQIGAESLAKCFQENSAFGRPLLILNSPSNPTGRVHSKERLQEIARVVDEADGIVISDEIYLHTQFDGGEWHSIAEFIPDRTIISTGLSKWCGAGGWRIGAFLFPKTMRPLLETMVGIASETFSSVAAPIQHAAIGAYQQEQHIQTYISQSSKVLGIIADYSTRALIETAHGARCAPGQGAFYLFPDWSDCKDVAAQFSSSSQFAKALLDSSGVAALPGSTFGMKPSSMTLRLSLVDYDGGDAMSQVHKCDWSPGNFSAGDGLSNFKHTGWVQENCPNVVNGIAAIKSFIKQINS